jgi:hypothetical protein
LGISQASVVRDPDKLKERIEFIHEQTNSDALVEEYIEGREFYVGVLGNERLRTFPVWEMEFGTLPDVMAGIATRKVKWDRAYQEKHGIQTGAAQAPPDGIEAYLSKLSKRIFRALHLSGYARMDFRMRPDGSVFVLEANANPNISHQEDFAESKNNTSRHLVLEEDVDGGGWAAVNVRVPATGHVFHEANVAGAKHVPGPITGANLDFAGQMNDQPAFGQGVEVHLSGPVKLLHPDLLYIRQGPQSRVLLQLQFLHMAFPVTTRKHTIDSHSALCIASHAC